MSLSRRSRLVGALVLLAVCGGCWCGGSGTPPAEVLAPAQAEHVEPFATIDASGLSGLAWTDGSLVAATSDGEVLVLTPGEETRHFRMPGSEPQIAVRHGEDGSAEVAWATDESVGVRSLDGEVVVEPLAIRASALVGEGEAVFWGTPERVGELGGADHSEHVNVLFGGQLAVSETHVYWADHNGLEIWAQARGGGTATRVATTRRSPVELTANAQRLVWREAEADLLPGAEAGMHHAWPEAPGWHTAPLALPPNRDGMVLGDDEVLYGAAECARLDARAWTTLDLGEGTGPIAVGPTHWYWARPSTGGSGTEIVRAPRSVCAE